MTHFTYYCAAHTIHNRDEQSNGRPKAIGRHSRRGLEPIALGGLTLQRKSQILSFVVKRRSVVSGLFLFDSSSFDVPSFLFPCWAEICLPFPPGALHFDRRIGWRDGRAVWSGTASRLDRVFCSCRSARAADPIQGGVRLGNFATGSVLFKPHSIPVLSASPNRPQRRFLPAASSFQLPSCMRKTQGKTSSAPAANRPAEGGKETVN